MASAIGRRPNSIKYQDFDDTTDPTVPLHNDKAFLDGIVMRAKYIGTLEIPRPQNRPEIISIMRRIRYENKARGMQKIKCDMRVAVAGVRVTRRQNKKKRRSGMPAQLLLESPIYRIFYVAHDSLDKFIFSLICRAEVEGRKVFICAVFKGFRKSQATRIVRTIGQVFEVCCRLQDGPDAANIPGLLPPDKLKAAKKAAEAQREQETLSEEELDGGTPIPDGQVHAPVVFPAASSSPVRFDASNSRQLPTEQPQLTFLTDEYQVQVVEYLQQQYSEQQSGLVHMAAKQQSADEANLLKQFHLSPEQQQALMVQFAVPGRPSAASAVSGLPSHPPNALGFAPARRTISVTQNQMMDDSFTQAAGPSAARDSPASAGSTAAVGQLIDLSFSDTNGGEAINPFTGEALNFEGKEPAEQVWLLFEMQKAQAAQLQLLKDQLIAETTSRVNAQAHVHHLLRQNAELVNHVNHLGTELRRYRSAGAAETEQLVSLIPPPAQTVQTAPSEELDTSSASDTQSAITEVSYAPLADNATRSAKEEALKAFDLTNTTNGIGTDVNFDPAQMGGLDGNFASAGFEGSAAAGTTDGQFSPFNEFKDTGSSNGQ